MLIRDAVDFYFVGRVLMRAFCRNCIVCVFSVCVILSSSPATCIAEDLTRTEKYVLERVARKALQLNADNRGGSKILSLRVSDVSIKDDEVKFSGTFNAKKIIKYSGSIKGVALYLNGQLGPLDELEFKSDFESGWQAVEQEYIDKANGG